MKTLKIVACYIVALLSFAYAVDAHAATPASVGPLGTSDVTFVYGSQIPGTAPHVTARVTPPTMIAFHTPIVIRASAHPHRRGTLNHASTVARTLHRVSASYHSGDLDGAPADLYGPAACETIGPRLDGTRVRICGGAVTATIGADGTIVPYPYASTF